MTAGGRQWGKVGLRGARVVRKKGEGRWSGGRGSTKSKSDDGCYGWWWGGRREG